jgi:VWFA-related protein
MLDSGKLEEAKKAVSILLARSNVQDEVFLMKFDDKTTILQDFTTDFSQLNAQINRVRPFGGTAIYDALIHGMEHVKKRGRRLRQALILITDGLDQHSRKTLKDVLPLAQVTGVPCYIIGLYTPEEQEVLKKGEKIRVDTGQLVDNPMIAMGKLAEETAGRLYIPSSEKELVPIAIEIVSELRSAYVLGYYPPLASLDGKYHQISVVSRGKKYSVRSRRGYMSKLPQE